jgi:hypothetical protein
VVGRGASDEALLKANDTIRKLFAYRHDLLKTLIADGMKLAVLGPGETIADLPEYRDAHARGIDVLARYLDDAPASRPWSWGRKTSSATPRNPGRCQPGHPRLKQGRPPGDGHAPVDPLWDRRGRNVQQYELRVRRLDALFGERLARAFDESLKAGKWKGTTASIDVAEHWAAGVLAYFDAQGQDSAPTTPPDRSASGSNSPPTTPRSTPSSPRRWPTTARSTGASPRTGPEVGPV